MKKILIGLLVTAGVLALAALVAYIATAPAAPPGDAPSSAWLEPGPFNVTQIERQFIDTTRPTSANGDFPGSAQRVLNAALWYPSHGPGPYPLVVYSHGFMSNKLGGLYLAQALASHGYVVIAADYPLTNGSAPGGPLVTDVVNQPGDVSFLIDQVLSLQGVDKPFDGEVDSARIGVAGISLGGLTSTLAGYHPRLSDPRISAVVSIAGPAYMFSAAYYQHADIPLLMIAGTVDAIVPYEGNATSLLQRSGNATLVTVEAGSHLGFVGMSEPMLRAMSNPDSLGCQAILANIGNVTEGAEVAAVEPFAVLGDATDGLDFSAPGPVLCQVNPLPPAIHPGRQQMITQTALLSFFASQFALDAASRTTAAQVLQQHLESDFAEVTVDTATRLSVPDVSSTGGN